jgi:hypothetical protein
MRARQLIGDHGFGRDDLAMILDGFEDAWAEIAPHVGSDPMVVEATRMSLARIVLGIAPAVRVDRAKINAAAVAAFKSKYGIGS